ncbi:MAG: TIGR02710 family CRISPR-associated protein [Candidatus Riflebacteria bacterium]|nr:TIGR02710 family CRISPR-associated protein [Candidatus Riflebacteria bacterium]
MSNSSVMICTVGGSHQPIVKAITERKPSFVCFVCSAKDPETGNAGSDQQILGKGNVIKANHGDAKPTLPNIPTQTGLSETDFEIAIIPTDDLDGAFAILRRKISDLYVRFPGRELIADYTGGTKTMTAALVTAVLESEKTSLALVTGNRTDLVKVRNGTEYAAEASVEGIRISRGMKTYLGSWKRFAYDEAFDGLSGITPPGLVNLRQRLFMARDISNAFSCWDRFDHPEALRLLDVYRPRVAKWWPDLFPTIQVLTGNGEATEPARLFDLWRNAQRRAAQGRFDDAVARIYRLLEWTAQWLLKTRCQIETSDIPPEKIPEGILVIPDHAGKRKAGLFVAWKMVEKWVTSESSDFFKKNQKILFGYLEMRNTSILAHGFSPLARDDWQKFSVWFEENFIPMLISEAKRARVNRIFSQLPDSFPEVDG